MTIEEHAALREAAWLAAHPGGHEYEDVDTLEMTLEELADSWNYLKHDPWMQAHPSIQHHFLWKVKWLYQDIDLEMMHRDKEDAR